MRVPTMALSGSDSSVRGHQAESIGWRPQGGGGQGSQLWVLMCKGRDVWELYADKPNSVMCAIKAPFHTGRSQCLTMLTGNIGMEVTGAKIALFQSQTSNRIHGRPCDEKTSRKDIASVSRLERRSERI